LQEKRLAAQSRQRGHLNGAASGEITEKEVKTLVNLCKSGKITADQLRTLSQVGELLVPSSLMVADPEPEKSTGSASLLSIAYLLDMYVFESYSTLTTGN